MCLIHEHITIPSFVGFHVDDHFVYVFHCPFLYPWFHVLLHRQIEHLLLNVLHVSLLNSPARKEEKQKNFGAIRKPFARITLISAGDPIKLPPSLTPLSINWDALNAGMDSSGAPTWMKTPLLRNRWRYFSSGMLEDETVQMIRSRERV